MAAKPARVSTGSAPLTAASQKQTMTARPPRAAWAITAAFCRCALSPPTLAAELVRRYATARSPMTAPAPPVSRRRSWRIRRASATIVFRFPGLNDDDDVQDMASHLREGLVAEVP